VHGDTDEVTVEIHNRGAAIPQDQLRGLFNPMKKSESGAVGGNGPTGNLGLGLYIAERIVNAHKGQIAVDSSEEDGTTFTVRLPRKA
jgi:signal transduction histidine kinase